jgi:hypothetical protein
MPGPHSQLFLLSPAFCGGRRAAILMSPTSRSPLAAQLSEGRLTLGEAFAFLSGLYFRGKLTYASRFGRAGAALAPVLVITPTRGLQSPSVPVSHALLREFASLDLATADARFLEPLAAGARALGAALGPADRVVLLGSIATAKYLEPLADELGERLHYPAAFVGRGDMSRGGLLLRCVQDERELEYIPLTAGLARRGARPPKLPPRPRRLPGLPAPSPRSSA